ncbi:pseudouridine synthase [Chitinophaga sp. HK235]|uniref:pseudouridine synthase n=1 Tax=Chitinophaga sp. HK235 TaxID=2952571 RepID=UPI001BA5F450|nr:pseudouridine synthase [Chitinophaga sp. HK235]
MKKKQPAKKGPAPFKGRKTDSTGKPAAGNRNRSSFDGERPGRASAKDNTGEGKPAFRKRTYGSDKEGNTGDFRKRSFDGEDKPQRKRSFSKDSDEAKPAFRKRTSGFEAEDKPQRKRSFSKDSDEAKPAFRKRTSGFEAEDKPTSHKRSFGDGKKPVRKSFREDNTADESATPRKRTYGDKKTFGKKPADNYSRKEESSFHGDASEGTGARHKETPSGFNRKKFFDRVNDRFTDKKERRVATKSTGKSNRDFSKTSRESKESTFAPGEMPLNKYIAHCGLCSRRKAVDFIKEGKVTVNGQTITEPATKVTGADVVTLSEKKINLTKNLVYILLNKPKGFITTTDDPEGRKTVMDLVKDAAGDERVYPVGRLDRNTSGLLLLTNDGELAQTLAHPKHNIKKIYQVELDKPLTKADFEKIVEGLTLEDGVAYVDALGYVDPKDKKQIGIEIHSGKNRIVRRIFEHLSYSVEKLDRVMYAGLTKKTLNRGQWRYLNEKEVILLKHFKK